MQQNNFKLKLAFEQKLRASSRVAAWPSIEQEHAANFQWQLIIVPYMYRLAGVLCVCFPKTGQSERNRHKYAHRQMVRLLAGMSVRAEVDKYHGKTSREIFWKPTDETY